MVFVRIVGVQNTANEVLVYSALAFNREMSYILFYLELNYCEANCSSHRLQCFLAHVFTQVTEKYLINK